MSKTFRLVLMMAFAVALAGFAWAQQDQGQAQPQAGSQPQAHHHGSGMQHGPDMDKMAAELNLNDDQKKQMEKIHEDTRTQAQSIQADTSLSAAQKKEKIQALHKQAHEQMMGLLTPEQKEKAEQMMKEHKGGMDHKKGESGAPNPGV